MASLHEKWIFNNRGMIRTLIPLHHFSKAMSANWNGEFARGPHQGNPRQETDSQSLDCYSVLSPTEPSRGRKVLLTWPHVTNSITNFIARSAEWLTDVRTCYLANGKSTQSVYGERQSTRAPGEVHGQQVTITQVYGQFSCWVEVNFYTLSKYGSQVYTKQCHRLYSDSINYYHYWQLVEFRCWTTALPTSHSSWSFANAG